MHSWFLPLLASLLPTTSLKVPKTHGVPPQFLHCYTSEGSGTWGPGRAWTVSNGFHGHSSTTTIVTAQTGATNLGTFSSPSESRAHRSSTVGTGACPDIQFYYKNEGHISASIVVPGQAVEPDCCDGLDEPSGVYENACKEVGEDHRVDAERNLRKTVKFQASKTNKIGRSTFNYHDTSRLPQTPSNPPLHSIIHRLSSTVSNSRHART
ncbi:hypothetical protein EW146_g8207 [Bondarzewia mesenterica]|uniref:Glucosidase II beta subunit N-terminal domain-containing protein n=1 Tax=Bondarzewia mesenterica TaxID=1095465 RepID=A0A4S4LG96_9AGAM|nr:hypothetical protein EW146_g8207 [Bondarzewia mesenterica]